TIKSPNPAFRHVDVPLASTFVLSSKDGKEAYVQPVVSGDQYSFHVVSGPLTEEARNGTVNRRGAVCLLSQAPIPFTYIRSEAKAGRMGTRLMGVIAEGPRGRVFLRPTIEMEMISQEARPTWAPEIPICHWPGRTNV